jgi:hypothetical protein
MLLDFEDICRDEECPFDHLHRSHHVDGTSGKRKLRRGIFSISKHRLVLEATFAAVGDRVLKPFSLVYHDVLDDYGSIKERIIYRALHRLVTDNRVAVIIPSGSRDRLVRGGKIRGGYIRFDSPLLWNGGLGTLIEQADDLRREMIGVVCRWRTGRFRSLAYGARHESQSVQA